MYFLRWLYARNPVVNKAPVTPTKGFQKSHKAKDYTQFSFNVSNFVNSPRVITVNPTSVDDNDGIAGIFEIILELPKSST